MEYKAIAKHVKISPRKVRLVTDAVKHLSIDEARSSLESLHKRAAKPVLKTMNSAIANAVNNGSANRGNLNIKEINVTEGIKYKRYHFAGRGRVRPYVRRTSHINIVLEDKKAETQSATAEEKMPNKDIQSENTTQGKEASA